MALKLKYPIADKAKHRQGTRTDICQKSDKSIDTKNELAPLLKRTQERMIDPLQNSAQGIKNLIKLNWQSGSSEI